MWRSIKGKTILLLVAVLMLEVSCRKSMTSETVSQDSIVAFAPTTHHHLADEELEDTALFYYCTEGTQNEAQEHWEDEVMMIILHEGKLSGVFWTTSDEFVSAREGYLPGFTVLPMQHVTLHGDTLTFLLDSHGLQFFSAPIDVGVMSIREVTKQGYHEWAQRVNLPADTIHYRGLFRGDTLFLDETKNRWQRTFVRKSCEEVERICRDMDADLELQNRREYWEHPSDSVR